MKRVILVSAVLVFAIAVYGFAQMHGMQGRHHVMEKWMNGEDIKADLSGIRPAENAVTIEAGRQIYNQRCTACHGVKGDGQGVHAMDLIVKPTDFTGGTYKFRSTPSGSLPTDEDIFTTISLGVRGTAMLPWAMLSDEEKWNVTYYIKSFSDRFEEEEIETPVTIPAVRANNEDLINKGMQVYTRAKCTECHGSMGRGDGPKAADLKDDSGVKVIPRNLAAAPLKRGSDLNSIYLTLATGLDGTPMASYIDGISAEDLMALSAYVQALNSNAPKGGGMMNMSGDERVGMMVYRHGMQGGMMQRPMMGNH
ncbi:MAG: c-type cytochrome [Nitrospira sp.]|nr:c-type cytochrome [bacterium]MBL7049030.1 c-type cytochrome [Nitrospira sp.]